jgi:hypothetical protein
MKTIHKIEVIQDQIFEQAIHEGWKFLCLRLQDGKRYIWVEVDEKKPKLDYTFCIYNTGNQILNSKNAKYLDTYSIDECIYHLYAERDDLSIWYKIQNFLDGFKIFFSK